MQKQILKIGVSFLLLTGAIAGITSCIKTYTCRCEISYEGKPGLPPSFYKEYKIQDGYKKALKMCQDASKTYTDLGITTVEECDLY
ncbi:MAG TPA: hypothetical protein PKX92_05465 [Edaphocola sp.]|nr:hypothetical protein [Edaphocola sp.]